MFTIWSMFKGGYILECLEKGDDFCTLFSWDFFVNSFEKKFYYFF